MGFNVGNEQQEWFKADMEEKRAKYGILEECLRCARNCKAYDAPGLSLFKCYDFEKIT